MRNFIIRVNRVALHIYVCRKHNGCCDRKKTQHSNYMHSFENKTAYAVNQSTSSGHFSSLTTSGYWLASPSMHVLAIT